MTTQASMNSDNSNPLASAPLIPLLIKLAIPAVFAQLIVLGYNIIDRIYLGRLEDASIALAALGITVPVVGIIAALSSLFGRGGAPLSSIALGAKNKDLANSTISHSFLLLILTSIVSALIVHFFAKEILAFFGGSGLILETATSYLIICNYATPFFLVGLGLNFFITAQGFTKIAMMTPLIGGVANIILNPIFLFVFDMGIEGVAIATVISQILSSLWVAKFFCSTKTNLNISLKKLCLDKELIKKISTIGSGPAFMQGSEAIILICFNAQLLKYGNTELVSSMTIIASLFLLVLFPLIGVIQGGQAVISYNYGAGNYQRVRQAIAFLAKVNGAYAFTLTTCIVFFPSFFVSLFTNDTQLIEQTSSLMRVYFLGCFFFGFMISFQDTYNALGDGAVALFFAFFRKGILLLPLLYILPYFFEDKIFALMLSEAVSDTLAVIVSICYFRKYIKKKLEPIV